jgi:hypothetical protein
LLQYSVGGTDRTIPQVSGVTWAREEALANSSWPSAGGLALVARVYPSVETRWAVAGSRVYKVSQYPRDALGRLGSFEVLNCRNELSSVIPGNTSLTCR